MTAFLKELLWSARCDYCDNWCIVGEIAWYNPKSKKVYHEWCLEAAEVG